MALMKADAIQAFTLAKGRGTFLTMSVEASSISLIRRAAPM
tara:strand:+ start:1320 stop:1442 length:123 start_codon:yes stop_codon:yes gene_type:complete